MCKEWGHGWKVQAVHADSDPRLKPRQPANSRVKRALHTWKRKWCLLNCVVHLSISVIGELGRSSLTICELSGRSKPTLNDVKIALIEMGSYLHEFTWEMHKLQEALVKPIEILLQQLVFRSLALCFLTSHKLLNSTDLLQPIPTTYYCPTVQFNILLKTCKSQACSSNLNDHSAPTCWQACEVTVEMLGMLEIRCDKHILVFRAKV